MTGPHAWRCLIYAPKQLATSMLAVAATHVGAVHVAWLGGPFDLNQLTRAGASMSYIYQPAVRALQSYMHLEITVVLVCYASGDR